MTIHEDRRVCPGEAGYCGGMEDTACGESRKAVFFFGMRKNNLSLHSYKF